MPQKRLQMSGQEPYNLPDRYAGVYVVAPWMTWLPL